MRLIKSWGPALVYMALIFFLSSRPSVSVSDEFTINFLFFKTLHVIEYFGLFLLMMRGARNYRLAFVLTVLYAISDEFHQTFVPTREGNIIRDGIIDAIGAGLAWIFLLHAVPKAPRKLKKWVGKLLTP